MSLPNYDQRFRPTQTQAQAGKRARLDALPNGTEIRIRAIVFVKHSRNRYSNDFRDQMNAGDVASVLDGTETYHTPAP